ncbi:hypothetical protein VTJ83DRAFT_6501 [Remersonia thermophila]|uniref:Sde2 N-terminal ubiquitin domain-containing protein n=1 Tax=Remersonia thermophila TaxID=72144 RepID=A0ABR4D6E0_9PEZI
MAPSKINVLITSFAGTGLPSTLSLALPPSTPIASLADELDARLPPNASIDRLLLTTLSGRLVPRRSVADAAAAAAAAASPLSSLLSPDHDFVALRLACPLPGGKGGFGSQLRAAGGRMSKKKKNAGQEDNGSSRNLDGRRLRTVTEAKALAEYLAIKPEMERREKEARRKRWQEIVEMTERRQEEIRSGGSGGGKAFMDGKWVEEKEEAGERTREAVLEAMRRGGYRDNLLLQVGNGEGSSRGAGPAGSGASSEGDEDMRDDQDDEEDESGGSKATTPPSEPEPPVDEKGKGKEKEVLKNPAAAPPPVKKFAGFDDEDEEFMSSDDE